MKTPNQTVSPTRMRSRQLNLTAYYLGLYDRIVSAWTDQQVNLLEISVHSADRQARSCCGEDDCLYSCCLGPARLAARFKSGMIFA